ncbi:PAS domain-containing protein [Paracoccus yeei]|uniref:PAS domain-containing protein n=1 Tax=Paracoccus yeei TaxID=147645 RepID=UPI003BF89C0E
MAEDNGPDGAQDTVRPMAHLQDDGGKLLRLADFEPVQPGRIVAELRAYWDGLRQGRAIPVRADVEPKGMRRALDYAFILERIAPGAARFRLAGRHLIDLMGMEVRGMPVCSFLNTGSRGRLSDVLESVFRGPQIALLHLDSPATYGRPAMAGQMVFLPLRSDLGDVTRVLGCLVAEGQVGQAPRRFDLISDEVMPVIPGAKVIEPSASATGFAERPAAWRGKAEPEAPAPASPSTPEERRARFHIVSKTEPPRPRRPRT